MRVFELVLKVEQPHTHRRSDQQGRQEDQSRRHHAELPSQQDQQKRGPCVGAHGADPVSPALFHQANRQAVAQKEQIARTQPQHHERMAVKAIAKPPQRRKGAEFAHGQRIDIAKPARVQISCARMMQRMALAPAIVGSERQHANRAPDPIVAGASRHERSMAAIVLDDKAAQQEQA